jgi:uncharacterized protein
VTDEQVIVERLRAAGGSLVFGSRARGDHRPDSDLDVAAWWRTDPPDSWDVVLPAGVDLVVLSAADERYRFEQAHREFREAVRDGR